MKKFYIIFVLSCMMSMNAWGQTFSVLQPYKNNYPNFENDLFSFDSNFNPISLTSNSLELSINNKNIQIDSILIQNSSIVDTLELYVCIELTSALNDSDKLLIKDFVNYLSNLKTSKTIFTTIIFYNDNQILLYDIYNKDFTRLDNLLNSKYYKKPDITKLLNSKVLSILFSSKFHRTLMLLSKSSPRLDISSVTQILSENSINFINFNFSNFKKDKYYELSNQTQSFYYNISDFSNDINFFNSSIFLALQGKPHKIFWDYTLSPNSNLLKIIHNTISDSINVPIFNSDIPQIQFLSHSEYLGIIDSGFTFTKVIRLFNKDKNIVLNNINIDNSAFSIIDFTPNYFLKPYSFVDLKIQYESKSTDFAQSILTINTNSYFTYKINLFAGKKPKISDSKITFQQPLQSDFIQSNEYLPIVWNGTFPYDTFKIDYKYSVDTLWKNITKQASSNEFLWQVPDLNPGNIDLKVSQVSSTLVSEKVIQLIGHKKKITNVVWSPNDSLIATSSEDGKILLWNSKTGNQIKTLFQSQTKVISDIDWSSDGNYIAISASDTLLKVWNIQTDILQKEFRAPYEIDKIKFSHNDEEIIGILKNGQIIIWDFTTGKENFLINSGSTLITSFELNPAFQLFATGSSDGKVVLWNYKSGGLVKEITKLLYPVLSINFSPSGNNIAISTLENKIKIFDINTSVNVLTIFDVNSPILAVNWLSNKQLIATSLQNTIKLWNPSDGSLNNIYDQHYSNVIMIKSSHSGQYISSVEENNIVHIWSPFDFPFERPELISKTIDNLQVLSKKISLKELNLPPVQKGDTLFYYDNNFSQNQSDFNITIDSIFFATNFQKISVVTPNSIVNNLSDEFIQSEIEFSPIDTLQYNTSAFLRSGLKTYPKSVIGFVPNRFFDNKAYKIDFGTLDLGFYKDTSFFALQNINAYPFDIDSVQFSSSIDSTFTLISPSMPYVMQPLGGAFVPKLRFEPKKAGINTAIFRIFFKNSTPVDIQLFGNAIAPLLVTDTNSSIGKILCDDSKSIEIPIYNKGNSILKIAGIIKINDIKNEISKINLLKSEIPPLDSSLITIEVIPKEIGSKKLELDINTNIQSNLSDITKISVLFQKDSIKLVPDSTYLLFYPQNDLDKVQKILKINNTGNIIPTLTFTTNPKYFILDSINSTSQEILLYITFIGGLNIPEYIDSLIFTENCNNYFKIDLHALINNPKPVLLIPKEINFSKIVCEYEKNEEIELKNIGLSDLKIAKVYLKNNSPEFEIPNLNNSIINPNKSKLISIKFKSNISGIFNDTLILETNASNFENGYIKIPVFAEKIIYHYSFSSKSISLKNLPLNTSDTVTFQFTNTSIIPIKVNFKNINSKFTYLYPETIYLNSNDSLIVQGIFLGSDTPGFYNDEFIFTDECGITQRILLDIFVDNNSTEHFEVSLAYPNPSISSFNINLLSNTLFDYEYRVTDNLGKVIFTSPKYINIEGLEKIIVNLSGYSIGVYFLEINSNKGNFIRKLIKLE